MNATIAHFRHDAARAVLRGLSTAGGRVVARARSPHGSDCSCDEAHAAGPMGQCRCVRVARVRVPSAGDWLLVWGDCQEGPTLKLSGPYSEGTPLAYGGGFWAKVTL
jgi:hypothetical protein